MKARHLKIRPLAGSSPVGFVWLCAVAAISHLSVRAATTIVPVAPSGFTNALPAISSGNGVGDEILSGFSVDTTLSGLYDTNITRSPGQPYAPIEDDFILSLGGGLNYMSKAKNWTFGANYYGRYDDYFNHSTFSGYNQGGGIVANFVGSKLSATLTAGMSINRGANTYYSSAFVEQVNYQAGLVARYKLSPKTSLEGTLNQSYNTVTGGNYYNTTAFDAGLSALWKYSPLTEFGPGLRYTYRSGSANTARTTIGPTLNLNYKLSTKVSMNARVGMDFASYQNGGSSAPTVSAGLGLNYQASKLWWMDFSFYRDSQADPTVAGRYIDINSLHLGYHHKLHRATLNLGIGYNTNTYTTGGKAAAGQAQRDTFTADASVGMPIFDKTSVASVFVRYDNMSGDPAFSYNSVQTGFSITRKF